MSINFINYLIFSIISTANDLMTYHSADKERAVSLDLKSLRAVRVIRPLKLVNGVPSKQI